MASLSIMAGSSATEILAERMMHMSHKLMFTALRSALQNRFSVLYTCTVLYMCTLSHLLMGEPCSTEILGSVARVSHSLSM